MTDDDLIKCFVGKFEEMVRKEKEEKGKKIKYIFKVNVLDFNTNEVINDSFFFDLDSLYEWLANVARPYNGREYDTNGEKEDD